MKKKWINILLAVLICLLLCFIWGNSMLPGEESGAISSGLLQWLKETFPFLDFLPELILRKLGHFSEFALLGFLSAWFGRIRGWQSLLPLLFAMTVAVLDETLQLYSLGRSSSVMDVWLDMLGTCTGVALLYICYYVGKRLKKENK